MSGERSVELLTVDEAGRRLAVSRSTVYRLVAAGDLVRVTVGERSARITRASVDRLVARLTHAAEALA